jgi:hypothetical protein
MPRSFTPEEANRTLPLVKRIVADILEKGRELRTLAPRQRERNARARMQILEAELRALLGELQAIGCEYKDFGFELGLVDFPARLDGVDVLLCWRSDEPAVSWFHPPEAGFAGRRPIPAEWR